MLSRYELECLALGIGSTGVVLNLMLLAVTLRRRETDVDWLLILLITALDLLCSLFLVSRVAVQWVDMAWAWNSVFCEYGSILAIACTVLALALTGLLGVVRYIVIVRGVAANTRAVYSLVLLVCAVVSGLYLERGMAESTTQIPSRLYCIPRYWGKDVMSRVFGATNVAVYVGSLVATVVSYCHMGWTYYSALKEYGRQGWALYGPLVGLLLVAAVYVALMTPLLVVSLYLFEATKRTLLLDALSILPLTCLPIINALYTFALHDETRQLLVATLSCRPIRPPYPSHHPYQL